MKKKVCPYALIFLSLIAFTSLTAAAETTVTRETLANGLRVVIVRNSLASAVTVQENYLVGADETPPGFPGMAHAQEHMAFRGCSELSADQIAAIFAQLGGEGDADTQQNITQYFETVPAQDLDIALRVDAACMRAVADSQTEWAQERGAIEQEVARDLSDPLYKFLTRLNADMFAGTPYAHDPLGTKPSFEATTAAMLKTFYERWYAPNNAILVITGEVDPERTLAAVRQLYGSIPRRTLPPHPAVQLRPVKAERFTLPSDYPYTYVLIGYRMPGTDSKDYAASRVLADALASERGEIYALVADGKALDAGFQLAETYPKASVAMAYAAIPAGTNPAAIEKSLEAIVANHALKGISADLVEAAKRSEVAAAEFAKTSIPGLAALWSQALAAEGRNSPDEDVHAIEQVTPEQVNRVTKEYLQNRNAIVGTLIPRPSGRAAATKGFGGTEKVTATPTKPVQLPSWAARLETPPPVPPWNLAPVDMTLKNGIRLIVQPEKVSSTVNVAGEIRHQPDLQTPPGKEGVHTVLNGLFSYGTTSLDRIAFQKALDDIAANESAGATFSLQVLNKYFDRGVQLLADNELHPALPPPAFKIVQQETADSLAGLLESPGYKAERAAKIGLFPKGDPVLRQATPQTVGSLTLPDVKNYYASTFRPDLTTIVVVGDITPEEARSTIEKWFGNWTASGPKPNVDLPSVPRNGPSAMHVPDPTRIQDSVDLSEELPMTRFDPEYYALQVGNYVLGGGFYATRLYRDLREKTGYVYNVSNELDAGRTRTTFTVDYGCDPVNVSKARALVDRDLREMQTTNVSPAELQQAKSLLLRQIPLAQASESRIASGFLARAVIGLPLDDPVRAAQRYSKMTADEVRAAFAKWIRPGGFVQVILGPPAK